MASRIAWTILEMMNGKEWVRLTVDPDMPDLIGAGWSKSYVVLHPNTDHDEEPTGWSVEIRQGWQKYNRMPAAVFLTIAPEAILRRAINRAVTGEEYEPDADTLYFNQRFEDREEITREIERTGSLPEGTLLTGPAVLTEERRRFAEDELAKLKGILAKDKGEASE